MMILQIGISIFVFIEFLNIIILYFQPTSTKGNGVGVFDSYSNIKEENREFVTYLVNWVAGAKLIFIMVGIVVVIFGNYMTQLFTVVAMIISISSFYWKLYPAVRRLENRGEITPKGYSKTLNYMILSFIIGFVIILVVALLS